MTVLARSPAAVSITPALSRRGRPTDSAICCALTRASTAPIAMSSALPLGWRPFSSQLFLAAHERGPDERYGGYEANEEPGCPEAVRLHRVAHRRRADHHADRAAD